MSILERRLGNVLVCEIIDCNIRSVVIASAWFCHAMPRYYDALSLFMR